MSRLWVDVDGTLIDGEDRPNYALILAINKLVRSTNTELVVWSGGGAQYAEVWAHRLFPWTPFRVASKDPWLPQPADLIIDDVLEFKSVHATQVMLPEDFIEGVPV